MPELMYGMKRRLPGMPYEEALKRVAEELKKEGFGILTEIDVKDTLKKKLGKDFRKYKILGACNPPFAYQALEKETDIGIFMPCNVIVYEDEGQGSVVASVDPRLTIATAGKKELKELADEIAGKLRSALERV